MYDKKWMMDLYIEQTSREIEMIKRLKKVGRGWIKSLVHDLSGASTAMKEQLIEVWLKQLGVEVKDNDQAE